MGTGSIFTLARFSEAFLVLRAQGSGAPADLRGTAFGFFNLASGVTMLIASVIAGALWDSFGAPATFLAGAGFCGVTLLLLYIQKQTLS